MQATDHTRASDTPAHDRVTRASAALEQAIATASTITAYDHWGSVWGHPTAADLTTSLTTATTDGSTVEEWHGPGRAPGHALTVVRITHPHYGVDIIAIEHPDHATQLLTNVSNTLEQEIVTSTQPPRYTPACVEELLGVHARRIHRGHCAAVHEDVRAALDIIGRPACDETPATLQNRILGALSGTEAGA